MKTPEQIAMDAHVEFIERRFHASVGNARRQGFYSAVCWMGSYAAIVNGLYFGLIGGETWQLPAFVMLAVGISGGVMEHRIKRQFERRYQAEMRAAAAGQQEPPSAPQ